MTLRTRGFSLIELLVALAVFAALAAAAYGGLSQIAQTRGRMLEINRHREELQAQIREREQVLESGRQVVLRLLGEASTLRNQLAQTEPQVFRSGPPSDEMPARRDTLCRGRLGERHRGA